MKEKIQIILWKWAKPDLDYLDVDSSDSCSIYCYSYDSNNINDLLSKIKGIESKEALLFLHTGQPNKFEERHLIDIKEKLDASKYKIFLFGDGDKPIYFNNKNNDHSKNGLLDQGGNFYEESDYKVLTEQNKIKKSNFEFVWDYYWNKLDLEYQKKKLINLWLPLAIDMQGVSEVENGKRNDYLKEVLNGLDKQENGKSYAEKLIEGWSEVKKVLLPDDGKQFLEEKYQIKGNDKEKIKFPVERENGKPLDPKSLKDFVNKNWENAKEKIVKENDADFISKFLPNWLQEVVSIIDKKIQGSSKPVNTNIENT
jgi:hypothetical protein